METVTLEQPTSILLTDEHLETVVVERDTSITVQNNQVQTATVEDRGTIVAEEHVIEHVVQGGIQGPPGVPGASTQFEYHPAGISLGGNRAVTVNSSGQLVYPDQTQINSWCLGITKHSALTGELVQVQIFGSHTEPSWSWNSGEPVFLSDNGNLTQTPPISGQLIAVGTAQTPTRIFIDINPPIYMG
jgi:hypothetical protein